MTRRFITRIAAAGLVAALASGCVTQPLDESAETALGVDPELGATAAPLAPGEADDAVDDARAVSRRAGAKHNRSGVWTAPRRSKAADDRDGGLVRVEPSEDEGGGGTSSADDSRDRQPSGDGSRRDSEDDGSGDGAGTRDRDDDPSGDNDDSGSGSRDNDPSGDDGSASPRPRPPAEPTYRAIAGATDPGDDASGKSPRYADIRQLVIESDGTNARVTVAVAGDIPKALTEGEVQGIGVDFFRSDEAESDYQLFVDGGDDGWRAFLQTPDGVVAYPGSFGVGGRVFVLEIPWSALGGRKPADVRMFIDWSKRKTPLNDAGNDRAPNDGRVRVDPR